MKENGKKRKLNYFGKKEGILDKCNREEMRRKWEGK
jgi:hypothetical protein